MKLLIFGATGGTGKVLMEKAKAQGHEVAVYVRNPDRLPSREGIEVIQGEVYDTEAVANAIAGRDAVLSCLGPSQQNFQVVMSPAATNIVHGMEQHGVKRLVWETGAGVRDEGDEFSLLQKTLVLVMRLAQADMHKDCEGVLPVFKNSRLDWVVVRVPRLIDGESKGDYKVTFKAPGPKGLTRADAADFMLQQLTDDTYLRRSPMIGY